MQKCHSIQGSKLPRLSRAWWCAWRDTGWTEGWIGWKGSQHNADSISALGLGISTEPPVFLEILRQPPWPWWMPCAWRISPLAVRRIPSCKGTMLPYRRRVGWDKTSVWSVKCHFGEILAFHVNHGPLSKKSSPTKTSAIKVWLDFRKKCSHFFHMNMFHDQFLVQPFFGATKKIQVVSGETHSRIRKPWSSHTRLPTWRSEKTGVGYRVFRFGMEGGVYMQMYRNSLSLICNADLMSMLGDYDVWFLYCLFLCCFVVWIGMKKTKMYFYGSETISDQIHSN